MCTSAILADCWVSAKSSEPFAKPRHILDILRKTTSAYSISALNWQTYILNNIPLYLPLLLLTDILVHILKYYTDPEVHLIGATSAVLKDLALRLCYSVCNHTYPIWLISGGSAKPNG